MYTKGKRVQYVSYLDVDQLKRLKKLSKRTRVPVAVYIRDGVDWVLREMEDE